MEAEEGAPVHRAGERGVWTGHRAAQCRRVACRMISLCQGQREQEGGPGSVLTDIFGLHAYCIFK